MFEYMFSLVTDEFKVVGEGQEFGCTLCITSQKTKGKED